MSNATDQLKYWCKGTPSEVGIRVAELLEDWQGCHHMDFDQMKKADWTHSRYISIRLDRSCSPGELATFDFDALTSLVFLAHDHCIRVSISPLNMRFMEATFFPREREGSMSQRHPTLELAVNSYRRRHTRIFSPKPPPPPVNGVAPAAEVSP
jgi:hypothetical protein